MKHNSKTTYFKIGLSILVLIYSIYIIFRSFNTAQNTGLLIINAPGSVITVTEPNYEQKTLNVGINKLRLDPGTYEIIATKNKIQETKIITVRKKQTTYIRLNPTLSNKQIIENANLVVANKLIQILPHYGPNYQWEMSYTYTISNNQATPKIIIISNTQNGLNEAITWLESMGYNPSTLNIEENISG